MFQSSSSRRDQYLFRSADNSKHTLHKKHFSIESKSSLVADSGYSSPSSTTAYSDISSPTFITANHEKSETSQAVNKKRRHQPSPRHPDLVYSCPRPLAFPFHNDDHFLPIAEADPRDVARVTPSLVNRSYSIQSKTSTQYDVDSSYSKHSSILSSIQRGTVRSIRSVFQLPNSSSNISQSTQKTTGAYVTSQSYLERPEIKKGTVQSLKALFTRRHHQQQQTVPKPVSHSCPKRGQVGVALGQFEASKSANDSTASLLKDTQDTMSGKKSLSSRASELARRAFRRTLPDTNQHPIASSKTPTVPISLITKPLPKEPVKNPEQPRKTLKSEVKKFSARVISSLRPSKNNSQPPKKDDKKTTEPDDILPQEPSKVVKLWNGFKNLMTGKKSSRVGVL